MTKPFPIQKHLKGAANSFFPFTLHAYETPHFTSSPAGFREAWMRIRPEGMSWFAYDVVIQSPTLIEFVIYGMRDTYSGGKGAEKGRFETEVDASITNKAICDRINMIAEGIRQQELANLELQIITDYAAQLQNLILEL